jgi:NADPH:quinone reductase-like Zn-dependent oxidoreductase
MKAIVYRKYGSPDVLALQEVEKPTVGDGGVLVRVHAASVNPLDCYFLTGTPWVVRLFSGLLKPKRPFLGVDVAGKVEAVGEKVTRLRPGDLVFGTGDIPGTFAEYVSLPEHALVTKPDNVTHEEAAAAPVAALTALQGLRDKGKIQAGHGVLIIGAGGGVGTYAVQVAKSFGAEVAGVCSAGKADLVRSLGADKVIDYAREDFARSEGRYDLILDLVGNRSLADCKRALKPTGICVAAAGGVGRLLAIAVTGGKRVVGMLSQPTQDDLHVIQGLLESGKVRSVIDRRYPLAEVPEAIRYVGEGHAGGKVVITMATA